MQLQLVQTMLTY